MNGNVARMHDHRSTEDAEAKVPCNVDAEAALLGAMMIDNRIVLSVTFLTPEMFYEPAHEAIFKAIVEVVNAGDIANPVTLRPRFADHAMLSQLGGVGYLAELTGSNASLLGAAAFAKQIFELYQLRELAAALETNLEAVRDTNNWRPIGELVTDIDVAVSKVITGEGSSEKRNVSAGKAFLQAVDRYSKIASGEMKPGIELSGLPELTSATAGGLKESELVVLAGRPGMGKTALCLRIAVAAARDGVGTALNSLEMSREQLMERVITDACYQDDGFDFTYDDYKNGRLSINQRHRMLRLGEEVDTWPLEIDDSAHMRVGALIGRWRRLKQQMEKKGTPLRLAIVDYLQLLSGDGNYKDNRVQETSMISRALKTAAKELNICVVALSQLSRAVEQRENKRPMLSDLRESGSIEQDADCVMFVYREEYYLANSEPPKSDNSPPADLEKWNRWSLQLEAARGKLELISAKVRSGATGKRQLRFLGAYQAIRSVREVY